MICYKKSVLILSLLILVKGSAHILYSQESPKIPDSEFEIFDNPVKDKTTKAIEPAGLQIDLVLQKQFARDSIFIPEQDFAAIDSWVFTGFLRFSKRPQISSIFGINLDLGLRNTTNTRGLTLKTVNNFSGLPDVINSVNPMFENELSFLHFYAYEFSLNFSILPSETDSIFLSTGILPVKTGNSFYKNPVSFFEKYVPPRDYIQEYSPLSFPAIQLSYIREIYHIDILFVPDIPYNDIGKNAEGTNLSHYLYFVNDANILMVKNSLNFPDILADFYFFLENKPDNDTQNHFAFGTEITWRIVKDLNISGQIMASNGRSKYKIEEHNLNNAVFFQYELMENSSEFYHLDALFSLTFSGIPNYEISLGYYYNGFGNSQSESTSLTNALKEAKKGYMSDDIFIQQLHLLFFSSVLAQYDLFALNQHYLFLNLVNLQNLELFTWGFSAFVTLENFSIMPVLFANFNINANLKAYVQLTANAGLPDSVFGESLVAGSINGGIQWSF